MPAKTVRLARVENQRPQDRVQFRDPWLRQGFTMVPNSLYSVSGLSMGARFTFVILLSYAWDKHECFPGQDRLAHDVNASTRSIHTYLSELEEHGLITVERRGKNEPNIYYIEKWNLPG